MHQLALVDRVGTGVLGFFESVGALATFGARAAVEAVRPPYEVREILTHVYQFGYRSAPLILTAGFAIGIVLSMHTRASLERFGAEAMIPAGLAIALIRETGPLTAGLLVAGRVGAGIGAEIGAMKVTEQIDALEANAVDALLNGWPVRRASSFNSRARSSSVSVVRMRHHDAAILDASRCPSRGPTKARQRAGLTLPDRRRRCPRPRGFLGNARGRPLASTDDGGHGRRVIPAILPLHSITVHRGASRDEPSGRRV